jgi:hypothetical protein
MSEEPPTLFELKREVLEDYKYVYCEDCNDRKKCDLFDLNVIERCMLVWQGDALRIAQINKLFSDIDNICEVDELESGIALKCPRCGGDLKAKHLREDKYVSGERKYTVLFDCVNRYNGCDIEVGISFEPKELFAAIDAGLQKRDTANDNEGLKLP